MRWVRHFPGAWAAKGDNTLETATIEPNLRRLRALAGIAQWGSVRQAAKELHLTQPTVTRAVQKLERELGVHLFDRSAHGMHQTELGALAARRAVRALGQLAWAERELGEHCLPDDAPRRPTHHLAHALTHRHLQALIAAADCGTLSAAAGRLGLSQPAVTQALNDLERQVGAPLLLRAGRGLAATTAGEILIRRGKLALAEIAALASDIAERRGTIMGRIRVGVLPLSGTLLVPRAVSRLLGQYPELRVCLVEGSYDTLLQALRCGDVDLIAGPLRIPCPAADIAQERLFDGTLSVIARKGHPLEKRDRLSLSDLGAWDWVLPRRGTPAYHMIGQTMREAGLAMPANPIESNGLAAIRALLIESDRLAMISRHQIYFEQRDGLLCVLPVELGKTSRPIGIATRADAAHPAGVLALLEHLRTVSRGCLLAGQGRP
jgi:DNA-binding transcriptional LysR family regulator